MSRLLQLLAALLVAAVTFATLGPPRYRPHSPLGQAGEHALAFVLVGLAVGAAFPRRPWLTAILAVALTGVVELLQLLAPGRHARWGDFTVDALALCAGLAIAAAGRLVWLRWRTARAV
jgi:VanZ family protein